MKKKILLLAVIPLMLAACNSGGGDGGSTTAAKPSATVPTTAKTSAGTSEDTSSVNPTSELSTSAVSGDTLTSTPTSSSVPTPTSTQTSAPTTAPTSSPTSTSQEQNPIFKTVKTYLGALKDTVNHNPFSVLPETMLPTNSANFVTESEVTYNFENHTAVSSVKYGGFGEQWHMVIENIQESKRFYKVLATCKTVIEASIALHNDYLDNATGDTVSNNADETGFVTNISYAAGVLTYRVEYKSSNPDGFFGSIKPSITMVYNVAQNKKTVKVELGNNNVMKFVLTDNSYQFGISYGITTVSRKAYFSLEKQSDNSIAGKIFEYVQFKDKDLVPSAAEFYIGSEYTSAVGNKASAMPGFGGTICEVYKTSTGKLLGYEVRESFTKWGITATYNTLWFNLNNITGINYVKAVPNGESSFGLGASNDHDIYLNNSADKFVPTYNSKPLIGNTSRKYDVEMRKQYFYENGSEGVVEHEVKLPMMFIQADNTKDTNYSDFSANILATSGIAASVNLSSTYLNKIQSDYATLVDTFVEHKAAMSSAAIDEFIQN